MFYVDKPDAFLLSIVHASFPSYRGKQYKIDTREAGETISLNSYWDGGSRNHFAIVRLADLTTMPIEQNGTMFDRKDYSFALRSGFVVVQHSVFSGKDAGITVIAVSSDVSGMLPAPTDLSREEKIVLWCTRSLKSSYGGISNFRYVEANRETGISLSAWDSAKQTLISKGLLNKAGAITANGRNACPQAYTLKSL